MLRHRSVITGGLGFSALATFYFAGPGAGSAAEAAEAAARVHAFWDHIKALIHATAVIVGDNFVDELTPDDGTVTGQFGGISASSVNGGGSADPLPNQMALLGQYQTGVFIAGRQVQGRVYLGPLNESDSTGVPSGGNITTLTGGLELLGTEITTPLAHVVWHRPDRTTHTGGSAVEVATYSVASRYGVQRVRR